MSKLVVILAVLILPCRLDAQILINGSVRYADSKSPVDLANVMVESVRNKSILGFATTSENGLFSISIKSPDDSLLITVAGFNIKRTAKKVKAKNQQIVIEVEYQEVRIQEAVIRTKPIKRAGDTLTFHVSKFTDSLDRSIGDVLRKMPGISVEKSGSIKYNGRPINRFYIDGLDMMGSRYGIATNNVRAEDIASVEVYENHQPIKALKELAFSENAALNLRSVLFKVRFGL